MKLNYRRPPSVPVVLGELDAQQLQFITEYITLGGRPQDGADAALKAGYGDGSLTSARRCANTLLASPKIAKALREAVAHRFNLAVGAAFNTLLDVCTDRRAPANARISAAQEILSRSEIGPIVSRSAVITAKTGVEELLDRLDREEAGGRNVQGTGDDVIDVTPADEHNTDAKKMALLRKYRQGG